MTTRDGVPAYLALGCSARRTLAFAEHECRHNANKTDAATVLHNDDMLSIVGSAESGFAVSPCSMS